MFEVSGDSGVEGDGIPAEDWMFIPTALDREEDEGDDADDDPAEEEGHVEEDLQGGLKIE